MGRTGQDALLTQKLKFARADAPCAHFGACGGCSLQDVVYADQLLLKRERVEKALAPAGIGRVESVEPLEDPWRYRNKAEMTFGSVDDRLALGYHAAGAFWRVVDIQECLLLPENVGPIVAAVREACARSGLAVYRQKTHEGFFRHLVVRHSRSTGRVLLALITASGSGEAVERILREVEVRQPDVVSAYWGVTDKMADVAYPDALTHVRGERMLADRIGPFEIRLLPFSFLQPSAVQADRIYTRLREWAGSGRVAWDLYCGMGLISLYLSGSFERLYGIESDEGCLSQARTHASLNGVVNAEFRPGKAEALLADRRFWLQEAKPDVVVLDPPRAGLHPSVIATVLGARPARIAYLSCNVESLARDLIQLLKGYPRYRVERVQPFDMFPQTAHVETLVILERV